MKANDPDYTPTLTRADWTAYCSHLVAVMEALNAAIEACPTGDNHELNLIEDALGIEIGKASFQLECGSEAA